MQIKIINPSSPGASFTENTNSVVLKIYRWIKEHENLEISYKDLRKSLKKEMSINNNNARNIFPLLKNCGFFEYKERGKTSTNKLFTNTGLDYIKILQAIKSLNSNDSKKKKQLEEKLQNIIYDALVKIVNGKNINYNEAFKDMIYFLLENNQINKKKFAYLVYERQDNDIISSLKNMKQHIEDGLNFEIYVSKRNGKKSQKGLGRLTSYSFFTGLLNQAGLILKRGNNYFVINDKREKLQQLVTPISETKIPFTSAFPRNLIYFGAPGTGKSWQLNQDKNELLGEDNECDYERVTFYPNYSYANFVGCYKPVQAEGNISYEYVPGPFIRVLVKALQNARTGSPKPYLLIIEEINRTDAAAAFGDIFQLLDRGKDNSSEYCIQTSEDLRKYLAKENVLGGSPEDYAYIKIPDNMFIWATMNSADQGVLPLDTAFKRRWDFKYLKIDNNSDKIKGKTVKIGDRNIEWNRLREAINSKLSSIGVNEDKLLGTYFLSKKIIPDNEDIDPKVFSEAFKNKVLMYLFEDAARHKRDKIFNTNEITEYNRYSHICNKFDEIGVNIFCEKIVDELNEG